MQGLPSPRDVRQPRLSRDLAAHIALTGAPEVPACASSPSPEGVDWVVHAGSYVGDNWRKVTAISPAGLGITEAFETFDGELVVNTVAMPLGAR